MTFFGTRLFHPAVAWSVSFDAYYHSLDVNWALFSVALWVLSILEDRELLAHFGTAYAEYSRRVPRLLPD
jgi:protein-S-isoprenylcysteine O-methyltransferase Ste14